MFQAVLSLQLTPEDLQAVLVAARRAHDLRVANQADGRVVSLPVNRRCSHLDSLRVSQVAYRVVSRVHSHLDSRHVSLQ